MSIEAMKQALEALEAYKQAIAIMNDGPDASDIAMAENYMAEAWDKGYDAIPALRAAIEHYERDLIPQNKLLVAGQLGAHVTRVREERQWQGLTTDEVFECQEASYMDTYSNIEAKLKEKNK